MELRGKRKSENGKWEEGRNAFNAEDAEGAECAEEEGKAEWRDMGTGGLGFGGRFG